MDRCGSAPDGASTEAEAWDGGGASLHGSAGTAERQSGYHRRRLVGARTSPFAAHRHHRPIVPVAALPSHLEIRQRLLGREWIIFIVGVFLTFAPVFVLTVTVPQGRFPVAGVILWSAVSGLCGVLWALSFVRSRRWLLVAVPFQVVAVVLFGACRIESIAVRGTGASLVGFGTIAAIALGYACFVRFIAIQGLKAARLWTEMDLAGSIHRQLVPSISMRHGALEVAGRSDASGQMGGDLMEAVAVRDGSLEVVVADVAGHGVAAGVVMAMVKAALHAHRAHTESLADLMQELNRMLVHLTEPGVFVTCAALRVGADGRGSYILAGHPAILHRDVAGAVTPLEGGGLPLGVDVGEHYVEQAFLLRPGDRLMLYTDGIAEVEVAEGGLLGFDALRPIFSQCGGDGASGAVETVLRNVRSRSLGPAIDDQTVVVVGMGRAAGG